MDSTREHPHSSDQNGSVSPQIEQTKPTHVGKVAPKKKDYQVHVPYDRKEFGGVPRINFLTRATEYSGPLPGTSSASQPQDHVFKVPLPVSKLPTKETKRYPRAFKPPKECYTTATTKNSDPLPGTSSASQPQDHVFKIPLPVSKLPRKQTKRYPRAFKPPKQCCTTATTKGNDDSPRPGHVTSLQIAKTLKECLPSAVTELPYGTPGYTYAFPQGRALQTKLHDKTRARTGEKPKPYRACTIRDTKTNIKAQLKQEDVALGRPGPSKKTPIAVDHQLPGSSKDYDQIYATESTLLDHLPGSNQTTEATCLEQLPGSSPISPSPKQLANRRRRPYRAHISPEKPRQDAKTVPKKRPFPFSPDEPDRKRANQQTTLDRPDPPKRVPRSLKGVKLPKVSKKSIVINKLEDGSPEKLGEGSYGYVFRGKLEENTRKRDIVIKLFKPTSTTKEDILSEARILHLLEDTDIVPKVYGLMDIGEEDHPVLIQECFGGGLTLDDMLKKEPAPAKRVWFDCCRQAAEGLQRIHNKDVLLNDIKEDNILIDYQPEEHFQKVKFIDMGIATFKSSFVGEGNMKRFLHIAPEVRRHKPSSVQSDIYGLGHVMEVIGNRADVPELLHLGNLLMDKDPSKRPGLLEVVSWLSALKNPDLDTGRSE